MYPDDPWVVDDDAEKTIDYRGPFTGLLAREHMRQDAPRISDDVKQRIRAVLRSIRHVYLNQRANAQVARASLESLSDMKLYSFDPTRIYVLEALAFDTQSVERVAYSYWLDIHVSIADEANRKVGQEPIRRAIAWSLIRPENFARFMVNPFETTYGLLDQFGGQPEKKLIDEMRRYRFDLSLLECTLLYVGCVELYSMIR